MSSQEFPRHIASDQKRVFSIIKEFGNLFNRLHVTLITKNHGIVHELAHYVNEYCSRASLKVTIYQGYHNDHEFQAIPFANATSVVLLPPPRHMETQTAIDLKRIFPRMQHLQVTSIDNYTLHRHFPNLIDFELMSIFDDTEDLSGVMRLNPQIRRFNPIIFWSLPYLTELNRMLPELQTLHMKFPTPATATESFTAHPVHFENVRSFSLDLLRLGHEINENTRNQLTAIHFEQLESFKLTSMLVNATDFQVKLIGRNRALRTIEIEHLELGSAEMLQLTELLPDLQRLRVSCSNSEAAIEVGQFLKENVTLDTVAIAANPICSRQLTRIKKNLSAKWTLSDDKTAFGKIYTFRKKQRAD